MKRPWPVLWMVGCCVLAGPLGAQDGPPPAPPSHADATRRAVTRGKFSINLKGVPFHDALEMLTAQAGVGLALDGRITAETLRQPLFLKLTKSSTYAVLCWIFRKHNLAWAVDGREIVVAAPELLDAGVRNRQIEFVQRTEETWKQQVLPKLEATRMSVNVTEVPLDRILSVVAERAGMNLVWETDAEGHRTRHVTLSITDAPVRQVLDRLVAPAGLAWALEAEAVVIVPAAP
ncbi:MAG TPA: hypothetical protein VMZ92_13980 [Planctomycetota bacterium]|nr:hypothetical protein [Planctomycetota bacterium]